MYILVMYDINTEDRAGAKRLNKAAKTCLRYGYRVQNSVFECSVTEVERAQLENEMVSLINPEKDSFRIYQLGAKTTNCKHYGIKPSLLIEDVLIF